MANLILIYILQCYHTFSILRCFFLNIYKIGMNHIINAERSHFGFLPPNFDVKGCSCQITITFVLNKAICIY